MEPPRPDPFVDRVRALVDDRLRVHLARARDFVQTAASDALPVLDEITALTLRGGKRLRAAVLAAGVDAVTPWEPLAPAVADAGAAFELLQTYLLVHDDWMDGDRVRRGGPSVHAALEARFGSAERAAALAVLAGDLACALAQEVLVQAPIPDARRAPVFAAFGTVQREVVLGQTLDVLASSDVRAIHDLKTGSYTVRGPLLLAHALAGGDAAQWRALRRFADPIGVAFQVRDDVLGAFGDAEETGKTSGGDLRSGKASAVVRVTLERLPDGDRARFTSLLGKDDDGAVSAAREMILSCGALDAVEERIRALRDAGCAALADAALREEGRNRLIHLAHRVTERRA